MARHIILESYTFVPSAKTIIFNNKVVRKEQLMLITNVTTNSVIYNYTDSTLGSTSHIASTSGNVESTTVTLIYDTTSMSSTDKLAIFVEETNESLLPSETFMDPVAKIRVSQPQSLIDTDFEYGTQATKWETIALMNNRPGAFFDVTSPIFYTSITGAGTRVVTVNVTNTTGITTLTPVYIQDSIDYNANGWFVPLAVTTNASFTYYAKGTVASGAISDPSKTYVFAGTFYTGSGIPVNVTAGAAFTATGTVITGNTLMNHGLQVGSGITIVGTTATTNAPNGSWIVRRVPSATTFVFDVVTTPTGLIQAQNSGTGLTINTTATLGALTSVAINTPGTNYQVGDIASVSGGTGGFIKILNLGAAGIPNAVSIYAPGSGYTNSTNVATTTAFSANTVYPRTWGTSIHRPFDGGVSFSEGYPYHSNQLIRQTRRTFRYQSGKGIQFSTGSNLCSPWIVESLTSSGATVTVTTKFPHNVGVGAVIKVSNCNESAYNGTFTVTTIPSDVTFTYTAGSTPSATPATGIPTVQPYQWYGSSLRVGMFNAQNGFFFQYDGQTVWAVRRSSTTQLSGYLSQLGYGAQSCTGVNTKFSSQLIPGDFIVIRGQSHMVMSIESDTSMTIYPDYRGPAIVFPSQVIISKTIDTKIPQSSWNIDKADGTGHTGFNLDITKMQMWYIDYTWYGAGAIRWGFRNSRGEIQYVNRLAHGNNMTEAYMRSGNLPGRYEVNTLAPYTKTTATLANSDSILYVGDTTGFPTTSTVMVTGSGLAAPIEFMSYTGKTNTSFTGLTRALTNLTGPGGLTSAGGTSTAQTFSYSITAPVSVSLFAPQAATTISHWGSSVIMDGRYDDDKSLIFVAGMSSTLSNLAQNTVQPLISLRISPSIDNGVTGVLGQREVVNSMQAILRSCAASTLGTNVSFLVSLRLNGSFSSTVIPQAAVPFLVTNYAYIIQTVGTTNWTAIGAPTATIGQYFIYNGVTITGSGGAVYSAWQPAGGSSLSQILYHTTGTSITGGENAFGYFTLTPGVSSGDLTAVRDIGNSILGGGVTLSMPTSPNNRYPDGPDIVTLCAQNVTAVGTNSINARISWSEAQA
jgi:hypothetical protein